MSPETEILRQIDSVLSSYEETKRNYLGIAHRIPGAQIAGVTTRLRDCIFRLAPAHSQYIESMATYVKAYALTESLLAESLSGVLRALREAYASGYLISVTELIHADMFSDFTEMAEHLSSEGYKDPAAVIIGSVLEEHLRQLCAKSAIPTTASSKPKKADQMNADLANASTYTKLDQKSITSWLDLRNKVAHGHYNEYTKQQVDLMIQSVRDFMTRHPA